MSYDRAYYERHRERIKACSRAYYKRLRAGELGTGQHFKLMPEQRAELIAILKSDSTETLEELGQRYGITRERVRQIAVKNGVEVARRLRARTVINTSKRIVHDNFDEAYNAVWQEAERQGYKVKAWANCHRQIYTAALFINGRRCWVSHITKVNQLSKGVNRRFYAHLGSITPGTRIVIVDNPLDGTRSFYIFLHLNRRGLFIPVGETFRPNYKRGFDWPSLKNAWHLLAAHHNPELGQQAAQLASEIDPYRPVRDSKPATIEAI